ncbi:hypothetical protein [Clostridium sp. BSD9I1]|uniref:hypothetical protein n=1 Tax=Clostridium sp. BSD9I1 TaxID=2003589 RepID=UPI001645DD5B|nr:hypothetical protein [Clostridium sp. BSD9I1]
MRRIAIIGENTNLIYIIKKELLQLNIKYELVQLQDAEVSVDYVIINEDTDYNLKNIKGLYYLVNMDSKFKKDLNINGNVITYGFGSKNTVTLSSAEKDERYLVYCLQRYIGNMSKNTIEPCELPIKRSFNNNNELYGYMIAATIALLEDVDIRKLNFIFNNEEIFS